MSIPHAAVDPYPAALVLEGLQNTVRNAKGEDANAGGDVAVDICQNTVRNDNQEEVVTTVCRTSAGGIEAKAGQEIEAKAGQEIACRKARRKAGKMLAECRRSQRSVRLALAARLAPDRVSPEIEREERRRQGLPPRDGLARRFVQMMA